MKLLNEHEALNVLSGTSLKGYLYGYTYTQLVEALGEPTFPNESGDFKVQKEWVFTYDDEVFTIYDWKTYDLDFTTSQLDVWNVGGRNNAIDFIAAIELKLNSND